MKECFYSGEENILNINLLQRCDGFSGADLSALVIEASMAAFKEVAMHTHIGQAALRPGFEVRVCLRHFEAAFAKVKPSVSDKDKLQYESMKRRSQVKCCCI